MSRQIWNEGRVVGLSAYELYVRHTLSEFGTDEPVMSEREWLASTLGNGVSLILKLKSGLSKGMHEFTLPEGTSLCAATGAITASLFNGEVKDTDLDSQGWATKLTTYGPVLISSLGDQLGAHSENELISWDKGMINTVKDFLKIVDGVVHHSAVGDVTRGYSPDLKNPPMLRIRLSEDLESDVTILFTGFLNKSIVKGLAKFDSDPLNSPKPQNGDFLGPEVYPWGTKVIFTVPSQAYNLITNYMYEREVTGGNTSGTAKYVQGASVIDYEHTDPGSYYQTLNSSMKQNSEVPISVQDLNVVDDKGVNVLAVYQRDSQNRYPAALYGARVRSEGEQSMVPIDVVAPGSVKVFRDVDLAKNYPIVYPNSFSIYLDDKDNMYVLDSENTKDAEDDDWELPIPIGPKIQTINAGTTASPKYIARTYKGDTDNPVEEIKAISMYDTSGKLLRTDGKAGDISTKDKLDWTTLLQALGTDKVIDLLGPDLRSLREKSVRNSTTAIVHDKPVQTPEYIEIKTSGNRILRLYISNDASAMNTLAKTGEVPVGSIGIGW